MVNITEFVPFNNSTTKSDGNSSHAHRDNDTSIDELSNIFSDYSVVPIGAIICVVNLLTIIILLRSDRLIYQIRILSINLAITNFVTGLTLSFPHAVFGSCRLKKYFSEPFIQVSLLTVTMFNVDRCLAMKYAYNYYNIMTKRVFVVICVIFWIMGFIISYWTFYDPSHPLGISCWYIALYETPSSLVRETAVYFRVLLILLNLFSYIHMAHVVNKRVNVTAEFGNADKREQINIIKKLSVITGFFLLCVTPLVLMHIIPNIDYENNTVRMVLSVLGLLYIFNSAINPILYVWRFTEVRFQFKRLLFFWSTTRLNLLKIERNNYFGTYCIDRIDEGIRSQFHVRKSNSLRIEDIPLAVPSHLCPD